MCCTTWIKSRFVQQDRQHCEPITPAAALTSACCKREAGSLPAESGWQPDFQAVHRPATRVDKSNRRDHTADRSACFACHSELSEESLISSDVNQHALPTLLRDPSHSLRMTSMKA